MYDDLRTHSRGHRSTLDRTLAYLRTRPTESWLFFAAGLIAGALLG